MRTNEEYRITVIKIDSIERIVVDLRYGRVASVDTPPTWHHEHLCVERRSVRFLTEQIERALLDASANTEEPVPPYPKFVKATEVEQDQLIDITWLMDIRAGYVRSGLTVTRPTAGRLANDLAKFRPSPGADSPNLSQTPDPERARSLLAALYPPPQRALVKGELLPLRRRMELMEHVPTEYHDLELIASGNDDDAIVFGYSECSLAFEVGAKVAPQQLHIDNIKLQLQQRDQRNLKLMQRILLRIGWMKPAPKVESYDELYQRLSTAVDGRIQTQVRRERTNLMEMLLTPVSRRDRTTFVTREAMAAAALTDEQARRTATGVSAWRDADRDTSASWAARMRQALVATLLNELPRHAVRVGVIMNGDTDEPSHQGTPTHFGNATKEFVFAVAYADVSRLSAIELLVNIGWTPEEIATHALGKPIERIIIDLETPVHCMRMAAAPVTWPALVALAVENEEFQNATQAIPIDKLRRVLEILISGIVSDSATKAPHTGLDAEKRIALQWLLENYAINLLYLGQGYTITNQHREAAREFMVLPHGTGFALTPDNHSRVIVGTITEDDFEKQFGYRPSPPTPEAKA